MPYNLIDLFSDIAHEAEVDRAAKWLELAADDYPKIFGFIRDNLDKSPAAVLRNIVDAYPAMSFTVLAIGASKVEAFIGRLQAFYKREAK